MKFITSKKFFIDSLVTEFQYIVPIVVFVSGSLVCADSMYLQVAQINALNSSSSVTLNKRRKLNYCFVDIDLLNSVSCLHT